MSNRAEDGSEQRTTDLFDLTGLTGAVTGASRGIGLAIARALLSKGARVLVNGDDAVETDATVASLRQQYPGSDVKPKVVGLPGDVTDPALAAALIDQTVQAFGRIDHLVCNAGIDIIKAAIDYPPKSGTASLRSTCAPPSNRPRPAHATG
jgi:NAD(P)-dependent dehydrogenase (short-subunit alcohol dehydrogenase family)